MFQPKSLSVGARQKLGEGPLWISAVSLNTNEEISPLLLQKVRLKSRISWCQLGEEAGTEAISTDPRPLHGLWAITAFYLLK